MSTPDRPRQQPSAATNRQEPLDDWIRRHQNALCRYLRLLGASEPDDLVQDAFVRFLQSHDPHPGAERLLRVIARGLWIDRQRWHARRGVRARADRIDELIAIEPQPPLSDRWLEALAECRETLAPKARRAIERFYRDGASRAELAVEFEMSEHGARNLLARTRQALKVCIESKIATEDDR